VRCTRTCDTKLRRENDIKMDLKRNTYEVMAWIQLAEDMV
jgi:hypothetical protein